MLQFDIFTAIGSCFDLKISCACSSAHRFHFFTWGKGTNCFQSPRKSADHSIASFHGKSADRSISRFHCRGSRQITRSRISQEMPNHRVGHFTGDGQITGPRISREMPNRRSEHFTSCQSLHIFLDCFIFLVLGLKI